MKLDELIASHVGATALNPQAVRGFLQTPPPYRQWGVARQLEPLILDQLKATDLVDFYLRLYLSGRHKTQHALMREVGLFVAHDPVSAAYFIGCCLALTRRNLLALEWYELVPRLEGAHQSIRQVAQPLDQAVPSCVVLLWNEFDSFS